MSSGVHDAERLKELQSLDLNYKIMITQARIIDWYEHYNGNVCVSFSGGKDSTVLLHIARQIYPDIPAVFSNTGLEYPEIQKFVKGFDNVDIVTPSMNFGQVITEFGYPIIGKEVAEAIYYARRIRSQSPNVERERADGQASQARDVRSTNLIETSTARNRRTVLQGRWGEKSTGNEWKSGGGEPSNGLQAEGTLRNEGQLPKTSRGSAEWVDWRRGCL